MICEARDEDLDEVRELLDSAAGVEPDETIFETDYLMRIRDEGILLIDKEDGHVHGALLGSYDPEEGWADLLELAVDDKASESAASELVERFEKLLPASVMTIDFYAPDDQKTLFENLGYARGPSYTAFQKTISGQRT